jgi:hypothetical protein
MLRFSSCAPIAEHVYHQPEAQHLKAGDYDGRPNTPSDPISMRFADGMAQFSERNQHHDNQFSDF